MAENKKSSIKKGSSCYLLNLKQPERTAKRLKLSFQRVNASVAVLKAGRSMDAAVGFLDISETGAGIFTPELLHKGSLVELSLFEPVILRVKGIVAWSIPVTSGIQAARFRSRSGIQFVYENETQKSAVKDFLVKVAVDPIEIIRSTLMARAAAELAAEASASHAVPVVEPNAFVGPMPAPAPEAEATVAPVSAEAASQPAPPVAFVDTDPKLAAASADPEVATAVPAPPTPEEVPAAAPVAASEPTPITEAPAASPDESGGTQGQAA